MLAAGSSVFHAMFIGGLAEDNEVSIPDVEPEAFLCLLKWVLVRFIWFETHRNFMKKMAPKIHIVLLHAIKISSAYAYWCTLRRCAMGLLPDMWNNWLRKRRECRERCPRHRLQRKPLISDHGIHHGTCVTRVPRCMWGSLTRGGGENVPGIPGACATHSVAYLARGPWNHS